MARVRYTYVPYSNVKMGEGGRLYPLDLRMFRQACDLQQTADALLLTCHFTLSYIRVVSSLLSQPT